MKNIRVFVIVSYVILALACVLAWKLWPIPKITGAAVAVPGDMPPPHHPFHPLTLSGPLIAGVVIGWVLNSIIRKVDELYSNRGAAGKRVQVANERAQSESVPLGKESEVWLEEDRAAAERAAAERAAAERAAEMQEWIDYVAYRKQYQLDNRCNVISALDFLKGFGYTNAFCVEVMDKMGDRDMSLKDACGKNLALSMRDVENRYMRMGWDY